MRRAIACTPLAQSQETEAEQRERAGFGHQYGHDGEIEVSP